MSLDLDALLDVPVRVDGRDARLRLAVPSFEESVGWVRPPAWRTPEELASGRGAELRAMMSALDGAPLDWPARNRLAADPAVLDAVQAARTRLYPALRAQGRLFAKCPHCAPGEVELDLTGLCFGLEANPWPIVDSHGLLVAPSLSYAFMPGPRPSGLPLAPSVRVRVPSARLGLAPAVDELVLRPCPPDLVQETLQHWARAARGDVERAHWLPSSPAFQAAVRLLVASRTTQPPRLHDPGDVDAMPAPDFFFLDSAYHLFYTTALAVDPERITVTCPACRKRLVASGLP